MEHCRGSISLTDLSQAGENKTTKFIGGIANSRQGFKNTDPFYSFCICIRCWILIWLYKCDTECDKGLRLLMTARAFLSCLVSRRSSDVSCYDESSLFIWYFEFSVNSRYPIQTKPYRTMGLILFRLNLLAKLLLASAEAGSGPQREVLTLISMLNTVTIFLTIYTVNLILIPLLSSINWYLELIKMLKTWIPWDSSDII